MQKMVLVGFDPKLLKKAKNKAWLRRMSFNAFVREAVALAIKAAA